METSKQTQVNRRFLLFLKREYEAPDPNKLALATLFGDEVAVYLRLCVSEA